MIYMNIVDHKFYLEMNELAMNSMVNENYLSEKDSVFVARKNKITNSSEEED